MQKILFSLALLALCASTASVPALAEAPEVEAPAMSAPAQQQEDSAQQDKQQPDASQLQAPQPDASQPEAAQPDIPKADGQQPPASSESAGAQTTPATSKIRPLPVKLMPPMASEACRPCTSLSPHPLATGACPDGSADAAWSCATMWALISAPEWAGPSRLSNPALWFARAKTGPWVFLSTSSRMTE